MLKDFEKGLDCIREVEVLETELATIRKSFKPFIQYDEELDCIRVVTADCSVTEVQLQNSPLVLLERNHIEDGQARFIGFHIEGGRKLCKENDLKSKGLVSVSDILLFISLKNSQPRVKAAIREIANPILQDNHIDQFEFPPA